MRALLLALTLILAGCTGLGSTPQVVRVSNQSDTATSLILEVRDATTRDVEFTHDFVKVDPGQSLEVAHEFDSKRTYIVNVTAARAGGPPIEAEQRVDIPNGSQLEVTIARDGRLSIKVLVVQ